MLFKSLCEARLGLRSGFTPWPSCPKRAASPLSMPGVPTMVAAVCVATRSTTKQPWAVTLEAGRGQPGKKLVGVLLV